MRTLRKLIETLTGEPLAAHERPGRILALALVATAVTYVGMVLLLGISR